MSVVFGRLLDSSRTRYVASAVSLALGLIFTLVWAPHPWPWEGIDQYHDLARAITRGEGFITTDVPWGYAYYLAFFYKFFGVRPLLPILGQVALNATMPLLLYSLVQPLAGRRTANLAALLVGVFSFNTVYASTQISDAICSVLFLAAVVLFARGHASGRIALFAASGILAGLTPQFRPNLLVLPGLVGGLYLLWMGRGRWRQVAVFVSLSGVMLVPWIVRNYYVAGVFLPTSSHGGIQLWYGSLQVGPYLENFSANPRTAFAPPVFDYSSLTGQPIVTAVTLSDCAGAPAIGLEYWTDRDASPVTLSPTAVSGRVVQFAIPGQPDSTAVYSRVVLPTGATPASIFYISSDHLGDLDRRGEWLDVFDIARLAQHLSWPDAPAAPLVDANANGSIERADLDAAITRLTGVPPQSLTAGDRQALLTLADGSRLAIPRDFANRISDLEVTGALARRLIPARASLLAAANSTIDASAACQPVQRVAMNEVFYRRELHTMRRYTALAFDNIRREPAAFAAASAYRVLRLFVVRPRGDRATTYQFAWDVVVYSSALVLSLGVFLVFLAGVAVAWRRRSALLPLLVPIVYVPATICFVLTNQRYTVTVQPLMFAFMALALVTAFRWDSDSKR